MERRSPDLLVLGAGPAGIAISLLMAQRGYSVEILDPASFPRTKICGEFLNPQAVEWLRTQDLLDSLLKLDPFPIRGMKIAGHDGRSFQGHYFPRGESTGYTIQRKDFDLLMVAKARDAGISILEGHRAERLLFDGEDVVGISGTDSRGLSFERRAKITIGADGRNNLIGRTFGWMRGIRRLRKYAFVTYFDDIPGLENFGEVHLVHNGYVGIAPLNGQFANVALVVDEKACPVDETDKEAFLISHLQEGHLAERFHGRRPVAPVVSAGPLAFEMKRTSGHRTLLVGDTCGFIDPFTGEGINYAFLSADLAVRVLDSAFRSNDLSENHLSEYDHRRRELFGKKFRMAKLLQKAVERPSLSGFLINRFAKSLALGDRMVSAVGSAVPVEEVWNFRFLFRLVFS